MQAARLGEVGADRCRDGRARLLAGAEARRANRLITRREGWVKRFADVVYPLRDGRALVIEITLEPDRRHLS